MTTEVMNVSLTVHSGHVCRGLYHNCPSIIFMYFANHYDIWCDLVYKVVKN